jgi:hypothetical protein
MKNIEKLRKELGNELKYLTATYKGNLTAMLVIQCVNEFVKKHQDPVQTKSVVDDSLESISQLLGFTYDLDEKTNTINSVTINYSVFDLDSQNLNITSFTVPEKSYADKVKETLDKMTNEEFDEFFEVGKERRGDEVYVYDPFEDFRKTIPSNE